MCQPPADHTPTRRPATPPSLNPDDPNPHPPRCIPTDALSRAAYTHAQQHLHPTILAHSLRVYLYAHHLALRGQGSPLVHPSRIHLLFAACILHDIGTAPAHDGPQRFEVEGADAARRLLLDKADGGVSEADAQEVWTAIAVHTSPGIAERISPLARLVRVGVAVDFGRPAALRLVSWVDIGEVEEWFPRGEIEKVLGDVVAGQVLARDGEGGEAAREKGPKASWPGGLAESAREEPGWVGVNRAF